MNKNGVSFIVCSFNGATRIPRVLQHLANQALPDDVDYEIVLVDNASTDGTGEVARQLWQELGATKALHVVHESQSGLTFARQAGIRAAQFEILSFVDDDNLVAPDYCTRVARQMYEDGQIGAIGARGEAEFEGGVQPRWFTRYQAAYAVGPQMHQHRWRPLARLYGAGLTVRKRALESLAAKGFFPVLSGRVGTALGAGDDTELCYALGLAGWRLHYDPDLVFKHVIPERRLQKSYLLNLYRGFGRSSIALDLYLWMAARRRGTPPGRLAFTHRLRGLLVTLPKVTYWMVFRWFSMFQDEEMRLNTEVQNVYFSSRLRGFLSGWAAERAHVKALSIALAKRAAPGAAAFAPVQAEAKALRGRGHAE